MLTWFNRVTPLGVVVGWIAIVLMFAGMHELVPVFVMLMCGCLAAAIWLRTRVYRAVHRHQGVVIRYIQEGPQVWSSHICGRELRVIGKALWRRLRSLLIRKRVGRPLVDSGQPVRLFEDERDRRRINELSLQAFEFMLDDLERSPGAVLISASVLNFEDRQPRRLQERIEAVKLRPAWTYQLVCRTLRRSDTLFGRWIYGWPIREGEGARAVVPGVVVWRTVDEAPVLDEFDLVLIVQEKA